jgi:hypothetical protein
MFRKDAFGKETFNRKYASKVINLEMKPVCRKCNNVRLGALESRAKETILRLRRGEHTILSKQNQIDLGAWITRIAILMSIASRHAFGTYFSSNERRLFMETLEPPKDSHIWLCALRPDVMRASISLIEQADSKAPERMLVATGVLGCFAFQFLARMWNKNVSAAEIDRMRHPITEDWEAIAQPIWPEPVEELKWPAKEADLTMETFYLFAARWGGKVTNYDV